MSDISFFLPRTDYMKQDDYNLLDSILIGAGFRDNGIVEVGDHEFRRYNGDEKIFDPAMYLSTVATILPFDRHDPLTIYMQDTIDEMMAIRLSVYGIIFAGISTLNDKIYYQFSIDRRHLPLLKRIYPGELKASPRIVEEYAYHKFVERGCYHGCDLADWFTAEWEANDKLRTLLDSIS